MTPTGRAHAQQRAGGGRTSRRLYLRHGECYRVRKTTGFVVEARWDDHTLAFSLGRGNQKRPVPDHRIAAVQHIAAHDAPRRWYPYDACLSGRHAPRLDIQWVHPIRARMLRAS